MFKKPVIASLLTLFPLLSAISSVKAFTPNILQVFGSYKAQQTSLTQNTNKFSSLAVTNTGLIREEKHAQSISTTPSPTETPTPSPSPIPTQTPSPTPTIVPETVVVTTIEKDTPYVLSAESDDYIKISIMEEINKYRKSLGLYEVKTDPYTCDFAKIRAKEVSINFDHTGFRNRVDTQSLPYPFYSKVTENLAMVGNYTKVVANWAKSPGHAANLQADTPNVCVEKYGNYYAYEGWKP